MLRVSRSAFWRICAIERSRSMSEGTEEVDSVLISILISDLSSGLRGDWGSDFSDLSSVGDESELKVEFELEVEFELTAEFSVELE